MLVTITSALRAELSRARESQPDCPLALFVLGLTDDGDLPAWAVAEELAPERLSAPPSLRTMVVGAAPLRRLALTLFRAGERELSEALRSSDVAAVPVVMVQDVVRTVKALRDVEAEEAESLLGKRPAGQC